MSAKVSSAQHVAHLFFQVARDMRDYMSPQELALSPPHFHVLDLIMNDAQMNGKRIAAEFSITPASASAMLKRLEADGYIERERAAHDRRSFSLQVTVAGTAAMAMTIEQMNQKLAPYFDTLSADERNRLVTIFQKLIDQQTQE